MQTTRRGMTLGASLAVLAGMGLGGCAHNNPGVPAGASRLPHRVIADTDFPESYPTQDREVIRSPGDWQQIWPQIGGEESPPDVNFDRYTVLVAAMGQRTTGGYDISIAGVFETEDAIYVEVVETSPAQECATIQVLTAPVVAVRIPRTEKPVQWIERSRIRRC